MEKFASPMVWVSESETILHILKLEQMSKYMEENGSQVSHN